MEFASIEVCIEIRSSLRARLRMIYVRTGTRRDNQPSTMESLIIGLRLETS